MALRHLVLGDTTDDERAVDGAPGAGYTAAPDLTEPYRSLYIELRRETEAIVRDTLSRARIR
jgi:hypothetical protein